MYVPSVWLYIVKPVEALSLEHFGYGFSYENCEIIECQKAH